MRCYYEELGVLRDSNDGDIKTAYRKLALRWHPDKNPNNLDEAKERFQLIQQAYEVLSDAQERAWYDNHREQILRGKNSEYEENSLDVFQYFTSTCYKGFGDDAKGFYSVYRDVFQKLATEDLEFMDDSDDISAIPDFGSAESNYEDVVGPFYAYWQAYSTKKTYEWLCPYDILEIKDRYILRKVEKEMKKIVQKARKERNEEVRNLVSFIRKRDRRVHAYRRLLEDRAELNRQKQEEKRKEQLRQRQRDLAQVRQQQNAFNEVYEEQLKQLAQEYSDATDTDNDDDATDSEELNENLDEADAEEYEYTDELYCVACNKSFKNANAYANHEESKRHRDNIEKLRLEMCEEEVAFNESSADECDDVAEAEEALEEIDLNESVEPEEELDTDASVEVVATTKRNKKSKKSKKANKMQNKLNVATENGDDDDDEKAVEVDKEPIQKLNDSGSDNDDWSNSNKKANKKNKNKKQNSNQKRNNDNETKVTKDLPKTKEVKSEFADTVNVAAKTNKTVLDTAEHEHICATCKSNFESKNKLFAHLKKTNHGIYLPKAQPIVEGKPIKTKGKRK